RGDARQAPGSAASCPGTGAAAPPHFHLGPLHSGNLDVPRERLGFGCSCSVRRQAKEIPIFPGTATCMCLREPTVHRSMIWRYLIEGPWIVFVAYWVVSSLKTRRTVNKESLASRSGIL